MKSHPICLADDPDLRLSLPAMNRAALRAREVALQTNTHVVVVDDDGALKTLTYEELSRLDERTAN